MSQPSLDWDLDRLRESLQRDVLTFVIQSRNNDLKLLGNYISDFRRELSELGPMLADMPAQSDEFNKRIRAFHDRLLVMVEEQQLAGYFGSLQSRLQEWSATLPKFESYPQDDACFTVEGDDAAFIRFYKHTKRVIRNAGRVRTNAANSVRNLFGADAVPHAVWTHKVNWPVAGFELGNRLLSLALSGMEQDLSVRRFATDLLTRLTDLQVDEGASADKLTEIQDQADLLYASVRSQASGLNKRLQDSIERIISDFRSSLLHAGTVTANKSIEREGIVRQKRDDIRKRYADAARCWDTDAAARLSQLRIDLGFIRYIQEIQHETGAFVHDVTRTLHEELIIELEAIQTRLMEVADQFDREKTGKLSRSTLVRKVREASSELSEYLKQHLDDKLTEFLRKSNISTRLEESFADIILKNNFLESETMVLERPDYTSSEQDKWIYDSPVRPNPDTVMIDFRQEATIYLKHELFRALRNLPERYQQRLARLSDQATGIIQIVEVNLDLADDSAKDKDEEASLKELFELVHDGLDRAASKTREFSETVQTLVSDFQEDAAAPVNRFRDICVRIMLEDDYLFIRKKNREARVKSTALSWRARLSRNWHQASDQTAVYVRHGVMVGRKQLTKLRRVLGFSTSDGATSLIKTEAADFLSNTDQKLGRLPLIYRRLFTSDPLEEPRFYKGRAYVQTGLESALESWGRGVYANIALIGERGSGKTSTINLLEKQLPKGITVRRGRISVTTWQEDDLLGQLSEIVKLKNKAESTEDFIAALNSRKNREIIILEGFQNMYLRHINGFAALEAFLMILSKTGKSCFWIVSSSRYGWEYLSKIYQTSGYFTQNFSLDRLSAEAARDIILSRHQVSGYDLHFEPDKNLAQSRSYRKLEGNVLEQQALVREEYFSELNEIARGNIAMALLYWQLSIREVRTEVIQVGPLSDVRVNLGEGFQQEDLFALGAIVMHDDLTEEQLAMANHLPVNEARIILSRLASKSILLESDGRYVLNHLLYRPVVELLKSKNILH